MKRNSLITTLFLSLALGSTAFGNGGKEGEDQKKTRPAQVTFITPLGTNGIDAPNVENKISLNILTGVNGGLNGVELGGLVNVITGEVKGSQFAGLGNYVHEKTSGAQFGGLFNVSRGYMGGGQFAGLTNISLNAGHGTQIGGLVNVNNGAFRGFQAAGLINVNVKEIDGLQIGGLVNYAGGDVSSGQIAGLVNVGLGQTNGLQIGGLVNVAGKSHHGSQIAGLINVAPAQVTGSQIGGIINYSRKVSGVQIGLINVADSVGGAQLGLFSYAGNGFMGLGVGSDETFHGRIAFKMGMKRLYNVYTVGFHEGDNRYWGYGLGLGSFLIDAEKVALNAEGLVYHINEDEWWTDKLNMLVRLNVNFQYHISPNFSLLAGASLNESISQVRDNEGRLTGGSFTPDWTFYEHTGRNTRTALYPGFNAGLEFRIK